LAEEQKRTVQVASVIGREFALRLLKRISDIREQVERCLSELKGLEFIYEKAVFPDLEYTFKHALTHDVAYASILHSRRRELHALIGRAMEEVYSDRIEDRLEELAQHFAQGEVWDKAFTYLRQAGAKAVALCADREAVGFYERALAALEHLPEGPVRDGQSIDLALEMRAPLWRLGRLERLFAIFQVTERLARRLGDAGRLNQIYSFLMQYHWAMGEQRQASTTGSAAWRRPTPLAISVSASSGITTWAMPTTPWVTCRVPSNATRGSWNFWRVGPTPTSSVCRGCPL
jgi:hypothetical protein